MSFFGDSTTYILEFVVLGPHCVQIMGCRHPFVLLVEDDSVLGQSVATAWMRSPFPIRYQVKE